MEILKKGLISKGTFCEKGDESRSERDLTRLNLIKHE